MSDLVERLRWHGNPNQRALLSEAADRIEELEAALQLVSDQHYNDRRVGVFPTHIMKVVDGVLEVKDEYMD